ncbi:hypothetical protein AWB80_02910 [Caballeronia pedi]|uniref:Uncharacterized protein n=1 Tax=Caballeronia pedi TaxID=1777141 RepID=A0A158B1C8_9BURK|nr:hypothetical protein [Caballeronia pedi]SAK63730.1 hypothetical protein AWB80_02910 [Caballeronia pedi]
MRLSERRDLSATYDKAYELANILDMLIEDGMRDDEPIMLTKGLVQRAATTLAFIAGTGLGMLPSEAECDDDLR